MIADLETRNKMIKIADKLPGVWKRSKNAYQTVSLVTLTTKGNLGQRNQGCLGKNKSPETAISLQ